MLRVISFFMCFGFLGTFAFAEDKSNGCGLGWKVTDRKSLLSSTVRSYTNMIGSQSSGMTSGTSGCDKHSIVKNEKAPMHFAEANLNSLMIEMAQGQGDFVMALGSVMGCKAQALPHFTTTTKQNYEKIFTSQDVTPAQFLENVETTISNDPKLAQACQQAT